MCRTRLEQPLAEEWTRIPVCNCVIDTWTDRSGFPVFNCIYKRRTNSEHFDFHFGPSKFYRGETEEELQVSSANQSLKIVRKWIAGRTLTHWHSVSVSAKSDDFARSLVRMRLLSIAAWKRPSVREFETNIGVKSAACVAVHRRFRSL